MYYIKADLRCCLVCSIIWHLRNVILLTSDSVTVSYQSAINMNACVLVLSALVAVAYTAVTDADVEWAAQNYVNAMPWASGRNYKFTQFDYKTCPVIISLYFYLKL